MSIGVNGAQNQSLIVLTIAIVAVLTSFGGTNWQKRRWHLPINCAPN